MGIVRIKSLTEIKQNGYYLLNGGMVTASHVGDADFSSYVLPPVRIFAESGIFDVFTDKDNVTFFRVVGDWANLTDLLTYVSVGANADTPTLVKIDMHKSGE